MAFEDPLLKSFAKSLKERYQTRRLWAIEEATSAYRLFDHEHQVPLAVELFNNKYLHVTAYLDEQNGTFEASKYLDVLARSLAIAPERIFFKERKKMKQGEQYIKQDKQEKTIWVEESGLSFKVNLTDYIDTGLFLDHRLSRRAIAEHAYQKRVLNLFCYTGSFSVYAIYGGAMEVVSVDLSNNYLEWAKENMQENGFIGPKLKWHRADVLQYIEDAVKSRELFDIIVLDPPVFSNSHTMQQTLNIQRDYAKLINQCLKILSPGGFIFFSTPLQNFFFDQEQIRYGFCREITKTTIPYDFRRSRPHRSFFIEKLKNPTIKNRKPVKRK